MDENPYEAPKAPMDFIKEESFRTPFETWKKIRRAFICGIISAAITLVITLVSIASDADTGFGPWNLIDVALIAGLTVGIYLKSRTCAIIMLAYFVISKIILIIDTKQFSGAVLSLVFIYFFAMGVAGTFEHHRLKAEFLKKSETPVL